MLEQLLALGQIPGTNFQITFYELVGSCLVASGILLARKRHFDYRAAIKSIRSLPLSRYVVRYRRLYMLTKKGTQIKLPV